MKFEWQNSEDEPDAAWLSAPPFFGSVSPCDGERAGEWRWEARRLSDYSEATIANSKAEAMARVEAKIRKWLTEFDVALPRTQVEGLEPGPWQLPTPEPSDHRNWSGPCWSSGWWEEGEVGVWADFCEIPGMHIVWELHWSDPQAKRTLDCNPLARGTAKTIKQAHERAQRAARLLEQLVAVERER